MGGSKRRGARSPNAISMGDTSPSPRMDPIFDRPGDECGSTEESPRLTSDSTRHKTDDSDGKEDDDEEKRKNDKKKCLVPEQPPPTKEKSPGADSSNISRGASGVLSPLTQNYKETDLRLVMSDFRCFKVGFEPCSGF